MGSGLNYILTGKSEYMEIISNINITELSIFIGTLVTITLFIYFITAKTYKKRLQKLYKTGKYEKFLKIAKKAINSDSQNIKLLLQMVEAAKHLHRYEEAIEYLNKILEIKPWYPEVTKMKRTLSEYISTLPTHLHKMLVKLKNTPFSVPLLWKISEEFEKLGKIEEAIQHRNKVIEILLSKNNFTGALTECDKIIKSDPEYIPAYIIKGDILYQLQKYKKAGNIFETALNLIEKLNKSEGNTEDIQSLKAHCLQKLGTLYQNTDPEKSANFFLKYLDIDASNSKIAITIRQLANKLFESKHKNKAIQILNSLLKKNIYYKDLIFELTEKYILIGELQSAITLIKNSKEAFSDNILKEKLNLLNTLFIKREIAQLEEIINTYGRPKKTVFEIEINNKIYSIPPDSFYKKALKTNVGIKLEPLIFKLGKLYFDTFNFDKAISTFQKLKRASDFQVYGKFYTGMAFFEIGLNESGKEQILNIDFSKITNLEKRKKLMYEAGKFFEKKGLFDSAIKIYQKIIAEDINYKDCVELIKNLKNYDTARLTRITQNPIDERYIDKVELGRGGMGIVFRCFDTIQKQTVAIKILNQSCLSNKEALKRFLREAQIAANLNHPNITKTFAIYKGNPSTGAPPYIVMEYLAGKTLREIISSFERLSIEEVNAILVPLCEAIEYAHSLGVIHRDIKPGNIMIANTCEVKIMDFGLAQIHGMGTVTKSGSILGTYYYMSPEQAQGKATDKRSDIYSLGITLYEMLAGRPPFYKGDVTYQHIHMQPPYIRDLRPELPESIENIVMKCISKKPEQRYQSARSLLEDWEMVISSFKSQFKFQSEFDVIENILKADKGIEIDDLDAIENLKTVI